MSPTTDMLPKTQDRSLFGRWFAKRWFQHLLFWIAYVALFASFHLFRGIRACEGLNIFQFELIHLVGLFVAVYVNRYFLIPGFLNQKKYVRYGMAVLCLSVAISVMVHMLADFMGVLPPPANDPHRHHRIEFFITTFVMLQLFFVALTSFLHFVKESVRLNEIALRVKDLESHKLQAELASLKAQINPHFLFNTLNNIYSHSLLKSDQTPEMILKLSDLMYHIIYECREERVTLAKEVDFIRSYVELERVRADGRLTIESNIDLPVDTYRIAPLIFVPLLENAFKHGVNIRHDRPYINIDLSMSAAGQLTFMVENRTDELPAAEHSPEKPGIGLENVRKRLELLYPGRHRLDIVRDDAKFRVELQIELNE